MSSIATINRKLKKIENKIEDNVKKAWYENGLLLLEIQQTKMYKAKYSSFEKYLTDRWDMKSTNGYQLINASKTYQLLENNVRKNDEFADTLLPKNEAQIRPLLQLESDSERVYVWNHIIEEDIKPTMSNVAEAVNHFKENPIDVEIIEEIETKLVKDSNIIATLHTGDNESYTPIQYINSARLVMGSIDIDPASKDYANERVMALAYYTEKTNGLDKDWFGNVWMNPPYASKLIKQFIDKLIQEIKNKNTSEAIMLTNNSADTLWFHESAKYASAICFTKGRINFYKADDSTTSPTNGQTFFYFGENTDRFTEEFSKYGMVVKVVENAQ